MKTRLLVMSLIIFLLPLKALSQVFTETTSSITGYSNGKTAWGDYDNDGDLDILICGLDDEGTPESKIYRNDGNGNFTDQTHIGLIGLADGDCGWQDYDGDGYLDILLTGADQADIPQSVIYRNTGSNSFTRQTGIVLTGLFNGSADWGDYDNDGDPDILINGRDQDNNTHTKIYRNNGNNSFTEQTSIAITQVSHGQCSWVDYDRDGDLDILLTGYSPGPGGISQIFMNNGNNSFTQQTGISLTGVYYSSFDWGDYDDNGYLDILLSGYNPVTGNPESKVYKNNGNNTFTEQTDIILPGTYLGAVEWGDFDNDGDLDIIMSGYSTVRMSELYRNDGSNVFTNIDPGMFTALYRGDADWGDFDNDQDLDLILSGNEGTFRVTKLYSNNSAVANTAPTVPRDLNVTLSEGKYIFSWNNSNDDQTKYNGISYNIRIGSSPGAGDIKSSGSDPNTGYNRLVRHGNAGHTFNWTIENLPPGNYFWSVQAIDHGYMASEFSEEKRLETYFSEAEFDYSGSRMPYLADYDRDGDIDIFAYKGSGSTIFRNDISEGSGFTDIYTGIPYTHSGDYPFAMGDYDNDGDVDIALASRDLDYNFITVLYRNDNGSFTEVNTDIQGIWMGKMEWGDYDNDGDLDLFLYGNHEQSDDGEPLGLLYRNEGNDVFVNSDIYIEDARRGALALADYNKDGFLDILTCGYNLSQNIFTSVLKNNDGESFTNIDAGIRGYSYGDLDWGDYDNDSYLDIFVTGSLYGGFGSTLIFHNEGDDTFTDIGFDYPGEYSYRTISEWGDYDNDGDLDVLSAGYECIIRNDGNNNFTPMNIGVDLTSGRWVDIDNDGDLDIVTGSEIYINNIGVQNTEPDIPVNLQSAVSGDQVRLSWDISHDAITPSAGISYNVCVGTSPGNWDILSPMTANSPEYSKAIPGMGNAFTNTFKIIRNLPVGTYYWTVQSVDNGFMSSDFASVESFDIYPMFTNTFVASWSDNNICVQWGDYNNDGLADFLYSHYSTNTIYINDGNDSFTEIDPGISGDNDYLNWGDFDNDGDLDIISTDSLFLNEPGNVFTNAGVYFELINYSYRTGDYDADGDLDILSDNEYIYRNDGNNIFTPVHVELTDEWVVDLDWFDYDNDSDLDIILIHGTYQDNSTDIFRNDGNDTFISINANMVGLDWGSISYADFDNDNDLDLFLGGTDVDNNHRSIIYRNNGDDTFTDINANVRGYHEPSSSWGDFDNDGDPDLIISGYNNGRTRNKMYLNNQDNTFMEHGIEDIIEYIKVFDCADYDNDGDVDAITSNGVFRNNTNHAADIPPELTNLSSDLLGLDCRLYWNSANSAKEAGYSYNIKIGTTPGGIDIKSPVSTPGPGNVPTDTSWVIRNLATGIYYWSVQAVNLNGKRGPWAPEESFLITDVSPDFTFDTVCYRETTSFTDLSVTTDEIVEWNWDFGDGNTSTETDPTHTYQLADTFAVALKVFSQSGDSAVRVRDVIVKPAPDALFSVAPVCKDEPSVLVNQSTVDNITVDSWLWDFGNGEFSNDQSTVQKVYVNTDTAYLTIVADNGCWDADTQIVRIAEYPDATLSLSPGYSNIFCDGDSTILVAPHNDTYVYQWQLNGANIYNASDTSLVVKGPGGDYSVIIENPVAACESSDNTQITVNSAPSSPVISADGAVRFCEGDSVKLYVADNPDFNYQWYLNGGGIGENSSELIVRNSGIYTLSVSNSTGCAASSANSIIVDVDPVPLVPTVSISGSTTFCEGNNVVLSTIYNPDYSYQWTNNDINITGENTHSFTAYNSGRYNLLVANSSGCISKTEDIVVTVNPSPEAPNITVDGTNNFCEGDSAILSAPDNPDYTYQWKLNGGAVGDDHYQYIARFPGNISLEITNSGGCSTDSYNNININVTPAPEASTINLSGPTEFCEGGSISMSVIENPEYTYQWKDELGIIQGETSTSYTSNESGIYRLEISNSTGCSVHTLPVTVNVKPMPSKPVLQTENYIPGDCLGEDPVRIYADNIPGYNYQWLRNGIPLSGETSYLIEGYLDEANYSLLAEINGCTAESDIQSLDFENAPKKPDLYVRGPVVWYFAASVANEHPYKWYHNNEIIPGANKYIYVANQTLGTYKVAISNEFGCYTMSDEITIPVSKSEMTNFSIPDEFLDDEDANPFESLRIYPNPTPGLFTVEMENKLFGELDIKIFTSEGRQILNIKFHKTTEHFKSQVDLSGQGKGLYLIRLLLDKYSANRTIVVE